ncbi:hypothetical protein [Streptomyces sp. A0592]|uniref:hypothetical protein n=1 Tax=Streptomyces sp. A0592 TaxID=2563099 RepID=UPI00109E77D4|nr:hypothetical protein [Streptomyces sp. A0592]THA75789.1 hypothetical protein E6U81_36065 [Streptomyces sp. A0592]
MTAPVGGQRVHPARRLITLAPGDVGVLVAGGGPDPVYFDVGSGPDVPSTSPWSAYDGRAGRPRAEVLRVRMARRRLVPAYGRTWPRSERGAGVRLSRSASALTSASDTGLR